MTRQTEVLVQTVCMCLIQYLRAASEQNALTNQAPRNSKAWRIWRYCADNIIELDKKCTKVLDNIMEQGHAATETDGDER